MASPAYFTWDESAWGDNTTWVGVVETSGFVAPEGVFVWGQSTWGDNTTWTQESNVLGSASLTDPGVTLEVSGDVTATSTTYGGSSSVMYVAPDGTGVYVSATTARLYDRLPAVYRDRDVTAGTGPNVFPLLRWLGCLVDQAGQIEALIDRFSPNLTSALTDPSTADVDWLPWLAQLVGVTLGPVVTPGLAQQAIANALGGVQPGTKQSIVNAVAPYLSGTQQVTVTDHYGGNPWEIEVATLAAQTPSTVAGEEAFVWGSSEWGSSTTWEPTDSILWLLEHTDLTPAGFTFVHTTS